MMKIKCFAGAAVVALSVFSSGVLAEPKNPTAQNSAASEATRIVRDKPANADPLGLELGYANEAGLRQRLEGVAPIHDDGVNRFTQGNQYLVDGSGLGVQGLQRLIFVFAPDRTLQAVQMQFDKDPKSMAKSLSGKYKLVSDKINRHMNYGTATFAKGKSTVLIAAPHLSFEMIVLYQTNDFEKAFEAAKASDRAKEREKKQNLL